VRPGFCKSNYWSEWTNLDRPDGDGDIETEIAGCSNPLALQVETIDGFSIQYAGQNVHFDSCYGFICLNNEQKHNQTCFDYRIRK